MYKILLLVTILLLMLIGPQVKAAEVTVGAGVSVKNNIRANNKHENIWGSRSENHITSVFPMLNIRTNWFQIAGPSLSIFLRNHPMFSLSLKANYSGEQYAADGMAKRKSSIYAGVGVRFMLLRFSAMTDTMGRSNGSKFTVTAGDGLFSYKSTFTDFKVGLEYMNSNYANYYFGVKEDETNDERVAFKTKGVLNILSSIKTNWAITSNFSLQLIISYRKLDNTLKGSPTVKTTDERSATFIASFTF